jgi:transposase
MEVVTDPARRRRWSENEKGRIVAETLAPGASVSEVARRWQVCPQQVFTWRREAREGHLVLPGAASAPSFVPLVPLVPEAPVIATGSRREAVPDQAVRPAGGPCIETRLGGAVVRVSVGADGALLTQVLRAVRASAA